MLKSSSNATLTFLAACQTAMGNKPFRMRWYILLGVIICLLIGLVWELELHKHSIWPLLIYAQRQILHLDAEFHLFVWGGDSVKPETHKVHPFTLTLHSVLQGVTFILNLAIRCKHHWKAGKVSGVSVGVHDPCPRCQTLEYVHCIDDHLSLQEIEYEAEDMYWQNIAGDLRTCCIRANIYGSPTGWKLMYACIPTCFFFWYSTCARLRFCVQYFILSCAHIKHVFICKK